MITLDPLYLLGALVLVVVLIFLLRVKWNFKGPEKAPPEKNSAPTFHASSAPPRSQTTTSPLPTLTPRERDILQLVKQNMTNDEIARELSISKRTVSKHLENISRKLGVRSRAELIQFQIDVTDE